MGLSPARREKFRSGQAFIRMLILNATSPFTAREIFRMANEYNFYDTKEIIDILSEMSDSGLILYRDGKFFNREIVRNCINY